MSTVIEIAKMLGVIGAMYALFIFTAVILIGFAWAVGSLF